MMEKTPQPWAPVKNNDIPEFMETLEPQEAMEKAIGIDEEDWEEFCRWVDGKL